MKLSDLALMAEDTEEVLTYQEAKLLTNNDYEIKAGVGNARRTSKDSKRTKSTQRTV